MWPLAAGAQQPKHVPRIGFLVTGSIESPEARAFLKSFDQGLREYGYIDGQNILVEFRAADSKVERFPALASELVRLNVDLIVASNSKPPATSAGFRQGSLIQPWRFRECMRLNGRSASCSDDAR